MGLSVNQASKKLGMEQTALNRRARHETEFRIDELDHIEEVLGIPAAYLLGFTEERPVVPPRREAEIRFIQPNPRPTDYSAGGSVTYVDFGNRTHVTEDAAVAR